MSETTGNADERLVVMLEARIADFEKRMNQAEKTGTRTYQKIQAESRKTASRMEADAVSGSKALTSAFGNMSGKIGDFAKSFAGGIAGGVVAAAFGQITTDVRGLIGDIGDMNDAAGRLGLSTDMLQGLEHGFKLQGLATDESRGALEKFVDGIGQAAQGTGTLKDTLEKNGIAIRGQNGELKSTGDLLKIYADLVNAAPDAASKMALVTDAFGRGGKAMVGALEGGAPAIDAMIKAAKDGGYVLDSSLVAKGAALDDQFDMLSDKIGVMFKTAVVESAGFFEQLVTDAQTAANEIGATRPQVVTQQFYDQVAEMRARADGLLNLAAELQNRLNGSVVAMNLLGDESLQGAMDVIGTMTADVKSLEDQFNSGQISAEEMKRGLAAIQAEAEQFLGAIDYVNAGDLSGITASVRDLRDMVSSLAGEAETARAKMGELPGMMGRGTGIDQEKVKADLFANNGGRAVTGAPFQTWAESHPATGTSKGGGGSSALDTLLRDLQSQREALDAWYTESQTLLGKATDAQLAALGGRHEALERLEKEHQKRMVSIGAEGDGDQLANAGKFFGALATLTQAGGQKTLRAYKIFAAGEALINTLRAQAQVLADPRLGFWGKLAAYAAIGASGLGLVSALGGSGKAGGGGGGGSKSDTSASGAGSNVSTSTLAPLVVTMQALDPKAFYTGQVINDVWDALAKEAGQRGLILGR